MLVVAIGVVLAFGAALTVAHPLAVNLPLAGLALVCLARRQGSFREVVVARALIAATVLGLVPGGVTIALLSLLLRMDVIATMFSDGFGWRLHSVTSGGMVLATSTLIEATWVGDTWLTRPRSLLFWCLGYTVWRWNAFALSEPGWLTRLQTAALAAPLAVCLWTFEPGLWWPVYAATVLIVRLAVVVARGPLERLLAGPRPAVADPGTQQVVCAVACALCLAAAAARLF